jgi:hypothetical protein
LSHLKLLRLKEKVKFQHIDQDVELAELGHDELCRLRDARFL